MEEKITGIDNNPDLVVDRISAMPNCILGHILSFLPTKEAVATAILSKRWKLAWVSVHNLDFYFYSFHNPKVKAWNRVNMPFIRFVHKVLLLTDAGPLNKFSLVWRHCYSSHVICWINAAIIRNVRELRLYLTEGEILRLPISGFNCPSLQSLELDNLTFVHDASVVCLPRLENLRLCVHFTSKEAFEKLISGCPMLHNLNLTIREYEDEDDDDFMCIISSTSLRRLDIRFKDVSSRLKLKAPSLEYLKLSGSISEIFVEKSLSSLVQADFAIRLVKHDFFRLDEHDFRNNSIVEAVRAFEHVKFLSLSADVMQALSRATISLSTKFTRLVKLEARSYCSSSSVLDFIQSSCNLETLIYEGSWLGRSYPRDHSSWNALVEVPICLSNSLKKVRLDGYKGLDDEREMIRNMLERGSVLEVMKINCKSSEDGEKLELLQEICEFPRKSTACKVQFCVWPTKREFKPLF